VDSIAIFYLSKLKAIREAAKACGYAVAIHGSMDRDFDLIAVPWVDGALSADELAEAVRAMVNGKIHPTAIHHVDKIERPNPIDRPHGRRAWVIHLGMGPYIDLSVMPRGIASVIQDGERKGGTS
jgi:hypothetical protein